MVHVSEDFCWCDESELAGVSLPERCRRLHLVRSAGVAATETSVVNTLREVRGIDQVEELTIGPRSSLISLGVAALLPRLSRLTIDNPRFVDLAGIKGIQHLKALGVRQRSPRCSLSPIRGMSLEHLELQFTNAAELDTLAHIKRADFLCLGGYKDASLERIRHLKPTRLFLSGGTITSLASLTWDLRALSVFGNKSLSIVGPVKAKEVHLYRCYSALELVDMQTEELDLGSCRRLKLSTVARVSGLVYLQLESLAPAAVTELQVPRTVKKLGIRSCRSVDSLRFVEGLGELRELIFEATRLTARDLTPLRDCLSLRSLFAYNLTPLQLEKVTRDNPSLHADNGIDFFFRGERVAENLRATSQENANKPMHATS